MLRIISFTAAYQAASGEVVLKSKYTEKEVVIPKRYVMTLPDNQFAFRKHFNTPDTEPFLRVTKIDYDDFYIVELPDSTKSTNRVVIKDLVVLSKINQSVQFVVEYEASDLQVL